MPDNDVDLKDVVDAINRLCENMTTSYEGVVEQVDNQENDETVDTVDSEWVESIDWTRFEQESIVDRGEVRSDSIESDVEFLKCKPKDSFVEEVMSSVQNIPIERMCSSIQEVEEISPVEESVPVNFTSEPETKQEVELAESLPYQSIEIEPIRRIEGMERCERWSDSASSISLPGQAEDPELMSDVPTIEPASEMYYTASSEVSLLSDLETTEKAAEDERKGVIAGHVAAMRERFESMTRANTPCPDAMRSGSPSLDARNVTPSPDLLG